MVKIRIQYKRRGLNYSTTQKFNARKKAIDFYEKLVSEKDAEEKLLNEVLDMTESFKDKDGKRIDQKFRPTAYCKRCGRFLTDPISVKMWEGPECRKKTGH